MSLETETTIMIALIPFLAVWALLRVAGAVERRRERCVSRQIALTDAIHRELGAAVAPSVRRTWSGEWVVSVPLALTREITVGAVARITGELFGRLDRQIPPRLRVVLLPVDEPMRRVVVTPSPRRARRLSRAA
ncbi:MAG TPA: hypothetical protein VFE48_00580 [Methylomirabilota bacterium]|nr:hypothetical protein [Methylomirabilota bacterium]